MSSRPWASGRLGRLRSVLWLGYEQKEATGTSLAVIIGVALANAVSERVLELSFAAVQLMFAWQLAKKAGLR